ncbi:hypothetical protein QYE76_038865 [Lolium multiflorum]|uniref:C2 domain-containing protein n=1 Tax=Lolium multiflorum TaxID=4521 RepID=A0AAD8WRA5_LOLMU|nr:hypothetical protein QYE76_038865 [Lolium multiflorum]
MAYRVLEVTLLSAKNLKNMNLFSRMEVYAVATIAGYPLTQQCTPPDPHGGRNPTWNATVWFAVPPIAMEATCGRLHILLRMKRMFGADRDVGEVTVPLAELFNGVGCHGCDYLDGPTLPQFASYQIRNAHRIDGRSVLSLTYRLGPVFTPQQQQVCMVPLWMWNVPGPSPVKPAVHGTVAPPTPKPGPPPEKPEGHVVVVLPSSNSKPAEHGDVPPSLKPAAEVVPVPAPSSAKTVQRVVSMPKPSPSPKPIGEVVSMPSSPKPVKRVVSIPKPPPVPYDHVSVPPSPTPYEGGFMGRSSKEAVDWLK